MLSECRNTRTLPLILERIASWCRHFYFKYFLSKILTLHFIYCFMIVSTRILSIHYSRCCYLTKTLTTSLGKYCHIGKPSENKSATFLQTNNRSLILLHQWPWLLSKLINFSLWANKWKLFLLFDCKQLPKKKPVIENNVHHLQKYLFAKILFLGACAGQKDSPCILAYICTIF